MSTLSDKVVVITGAANGIGAAVVHMLIEERVKHVRVLDVDETSGIALEDDITKKHGDNKVKFVKCDVSNDNQFLAAFKNITDEFGYIDVVINNAGVANESDTARIRKMVDINYTALVNGTIKAIELMRIDNGGRGGTIINISSIAALWQRSPTIFVYSGTKSAVLHFSCCIGGEPYHSTTGVRVLTVCFGFTDTGLLSNVITFDKVVNQMMEGIMNTFPAQSSELAAKGVIEAFKTGDSGSTWLINNGKLKNITANVSRAYEELKKAFMID